MLYLLLLILLSMNSKTGCIRNSVTTLYFLFLFFSFVCSSLSPLHLPYFFTFSFLFPFTKGNINIKCSKHIFFCGWTFSFLSLSFFSTNQHTSTHTHTHTHTHTLTQTHKCMFRCVTLALVASQQCW